MSNSKIPMSCHFETLVCICLLSTFGNSEHVNNIQWLAGEEDVTDAIFRAYVAKSINSIELRLSNQESLIDWLNRALVTIEQQLETRKRLLDSLEKSLPNELKLKIDGLENAFSEIQQTTTKHGQELEAISKIMGASPSGNSLSDSVLTLNQYANEIERNGMTYKSLTDAKLNTLTDSLVKLEKQQKDYDQNISKFVSAIETAQNSTSFMKTEQLELKNMVNRIIDEFNTSTVLPEDFPTERLMQIDDKVVRGPDWSFGDEDGGSGSGIILDQATCPGYKRIRWRNGITKDYRYGAGNKLEIDIYSSSSLYLIHRLLTIYYTSYHNSHARFFRSTEYTGGITEGVDFRNCPKSHTCCTNLCGLDDDTRSVLTYGTCIEVFLDKECAGESRMFHGETGSPRHDNFGDFNDKISSVKPC